MERASHCSSYGQEQNVSLPLLTMILASQDSPRLSLKTNIPRLGEAGVPLNKTFAIAVYWFSVAGLYWNWETKAAVHQLEAKAHQVTACCASLMT